MKHFYSPLIDFNEITVILGECEMTAEDKEMLEQLAESTVHHVIIDAILITLPEKEHSTFLNNLILDKHRKTRRHLQDHIPELEKVVREAFSQAKSLLAGDF